MKELWNNQIALALVVFCIIVIGSLWRLDPPTAKEIIIQVVTAVGALVTGGAIERAKNTRATDQPGKETRDL